MNKQMVAKVLAQRGIEYASLKRPQQTFVAVLTFTDLAQREAAQAKLKGMMCKGRELRAVVAAAQDWGSRQRRGEFEGGNRGDGEGGGKRQRTEKDAPAAPPKSVDEVVTPLLHLPYAQQLAQKEAEMREQCVQRMFHDVKAAYHHRRRKMAKEKGQGGGQAAGAAGAVCVLVVFGSLF